jgi:hypothetical protein
MDQGLNGRAVLRFEATGSGKVLQARGVDDETVLDPAEWPVWRKTALTRASRISGPFIVETSEGPLRCADGWLAVDARGYPYPIAADEFDQIYGSVARSEAEQPPVDTIDLIDEMPEAVKRLRASVEANSAI